MKNTSKKGEITSGTLIIIIIAIVSLVAILILFFNLNLGKVTDQEVCHYSVVARASAIAANNLLKDTLPLNCKTQYVCITEDGNCGKLISPEIEKVKSKEEVYEALTTQLVDCWWMFGEGQVDYLGKEVLKAGSLYCSLCSQVAFDDSLTSIEGLESGEIDREDFFHYLSVEYKDEIEKISYWNYLYGESTPEEISSAIKQEDETYNLGKINFNNRYYVVMGSISKIDWSVWKIASIGAAVGTIVGLATGPAGWAILAITAAGVSGGSAYIGQITEGELEQQFLRPTIIEANSKEFELLKCRDVNTIG